MVRGGAIVWVPDDGGQTEIVGGDARLLYDSPAAAVASIVATLRDPARQADLRAHLARRAAAFGADRFVTEFRAVVAEALEWKRGAAAAPRTGEPT